MKRIAFIGIGNMGWPMAANLVAKGFDLAVADTDAARVARFAGETGARAAADAADAAGAAAGVASFLPQPTRAATATADKAATFSIERFFRSVMGSSGCKGVGGKTGL